MKMTRALLVLGMLADTTFDEAVQRLEPGDQVLFYTDGISEARNPQGEMFTTRRLDQALADCSLQASSLLASVLRSLEEFTKGFPADDDRTMIVARVS